METLITVVISILGTLASVAGFVFALWEHKKKKNLEEYIRINSWFLYERANNSNGNLQLAIRLYKEMYSQDMDVGVIEQFARADAHGQELFKEAIRQIHMSEPSFSNKDFERWVREGKLGETKKQLFLKYSTDASIDLALTKQS
jgi:hypothetical protein